MEITLNHIRDALENNDKLFHFLAFGSESGRGFPFKVHLLAKSANPDDIDVSRNGNVVLDRKNPAMVRCYKSGFDPGPV